MPHYATMKQTGVNKNNAYIIRQYVTLDTTRSSFNIIIYNTPPFKDLWWTIATTPNCSCSCHQCTLTLHIPQNKPKKVNYNHQPLIRWLIVNAPWDGITIWWISGCDKVTGLTTNPRECNNEYLDAINKTTWHASYICSAVTSDIRFIFNSS